MSWARGDDRYDDTPKIKRAWRLSGYAVGLHWMAVTSCCRHESDGLVDPEWLAERLGVIPPKAAKTAIETLVALGLFEQLPAGATQTLRDRNDNVITLGPITEDAYIVHDYLDFQDSSLTLTERRAAERLRKAIATRAKELGMSVSDYRNSAGFRPDFPADSGRKDAGIQTASEDPDPTRPDPTRPIPPDPPQGGGLQDEFGDAPQKANPRHLKTNPRAVGLRLAATEAAGRASLAVAALSKPNDQHRAEWERLHTALIGAVSGFAETYVVDLCLSAVEGDTLVIGGTATAWGWAVERFRNPLAAVSENLGIPARLASHDEFSGLGGTDKGEEAA